MAKHRSREDLDKFIQDMEARQRNIVWPDTARNARKFYEYLWKGGGRGDGGDPNPTLVQRIAAWMIGFVFLGGGIGYLNQAFRSFSGGWSQGIVGLVMAAFGVKIGAFGFRGLRERKPYDLE